MFVCLCILRKCPLAISRDNKLLHKKIGDGNFSCVGRASEWNESVSSRRRVRKAKDDFHFSKRKGENGRGNVASRKIFLKGDFAAFFSSSFGCCYVNVLWCCEFE